MHSSLAFGLLVLTTGVVSQSSSQPACVTSCFSSNPVSSQCDGDETGDALAKCTCNSLFGSSLLACIKKCSAADQATYASNLPPTCAASLFGSAAGSSSSSSSGTGTSSATSSAAPTTAGGSSTASQNAATTTSSGNTSSTSKAAAQTIVPNFVAGGIAAAMLFL